MGSKKHTTYDMLWPPSTSYRKISLNMKFSKNNSILFTASMVFPFIELNCFIFFMKEAMHNASETIHLTIESYIRIQNCPRLPHRTLFRNLKTSLESVTKRKFPFSNASYKVVRFTHVLLWYSVKQTSVKTRYNILAREIWNYFYTLSAEMF